MSNEEVKKQRKIEYRLGKLEKLQAQQKHISKEAFRTIDQLKELVIG